MIYLINNKKIAVIVDGGIQTEFSRIKKSKVYPYSDHDVESSIDGVDRDIREVRAGVILKETT